MRACISVLLSCNAWVMRRGRMEVKPSAGISLHVSKAPRGSTRFNLFIRRTFRYQPYIFLHIIFTAVIKSRILYSTVPPNCSLRKKLKIPTLPGIEPGTAACETVALIKILNVILEKRDNIDQIINHCIKKSDVI